MYIYQPEHILPERIKQAEEILKQIPVKHAFISGSFLFSHKYNDIDLFVISRSKNKFSLPKGVKLNHLDFNQLYSLFYHSLIKICVSKSILPVRPIKTTIAHYWNIINEIVPEYLNYQNLKQLRSLILYTEYYKNNHILDSKELYFLTKDLKDPLGYILKEVPGIMTKIGKFSYLKRFFYTQAGFYKDIEYDSQKYLYQLTHSITNEL